MAVFEDDYTALNYKAVTPRLRKQSKSRFMPQTDSYQKIIGKTRPSLVRTRARDGFETVADDNSFLVDDKYKNVVFDADTESEGIAVHRDYQIYERLKNSTMGKKLDDLSTRVSASESNFVRGGIYFTSKIGNKLSKLTTNDFNECMK